MGGGKKKGKKERQASGMPMLESQESLMSFDEGEAEQQMRNVLAGGLYEPSEEQLENRGNVARGYEDEEYNEGNYDAQAMDTGSQGAPKRLPPHAPPARRRVI